MTMLTIYLIGIVVVSFILILKTKDSRLVFRIGLVGLFLNLIWELGQMKWYQGFSTFSDHIVCVPAAFGDVLAVLSLYAVVAYVKHDWLWYKSIDRSSVTITVLLGGLLAIVMEERALMLGLWSYTSDMPLVPFFHVGLLPVLQMMLLPLVSFAIVHKIFPIRNGKKL